MSISHRCSLCRSLQRLLLRRSSGSAYLDGTSVVTGTFALQTEDSMPPPSTIDVAAPVTPSTPVVTAPIPSPAVEISRGNQPQARSNDKSREADASTDEGVDEFGYALKSAEKLLSAKYPGHQSVRLLDIEKQARRHIGISLVGNRDPNQMSVFVCGIRPEGAAAIDGRLRIGDELLEVNGQVLLGKSHVNAAPIIAGCQTRSVKLVIARRPDAIESMAVKPLQPPLSLPVDPKSVGISSAASKKTIVIESSSPVGTSSYLTALPQEVQNGSKPAAMDSHIEHSQQDKSVSAASLERTDSNAQTVGPYGVEITCILVKGKQGLGFAIMERSAQEEPGIYVKHITDKGPAAAEGSLRTGDRLLRANEFTLADASYDEALDRLRSMSGEVRITVARRLEPQQLQQQLKPAVARVKKEVRIALPTPEDIAGTVKTDPTDSDGLKAASANCVPVASLQLVDAIAAPDAPAASSEIMVKDKKDAGPGTDQGAADNVAPATCEILPGRETLIEIDKGDGTLGLSIVGGSDTTLNAIVIHEVYDTGAAWRDRRLWAGDQILAVDERDLSNVSHEEAKNIILQAGPKVRLRVWRDDKEITETDLYELISVELVRKPGIGLGFSIVGRSKDEGVLISDIIKGGVAESDRRLQPGDRILEINGKNVRKTPHAEVARVLKSSQGKVSFLIGRLKHVGVVKSKKKAGGF